MKNEAQPFFARQAWVAGAWARDVLLGVSSDGHWSRAGPGRRKRVRGGRVEIGFELGLRRFRVERLGRS